MHKRGNHEQSENFRPLSVLPVLSKIFESVLKGSVVRLFCSDGQLSAAQHVSRTGLFTVQAVERLINDVLESFESLLYGLRLWDRAPVVRRVSYFKRMPLGP